MPGSTTITALPSRISVTVPATRPSSPSRPTYPSCSTNTDADPLGAIFTSATEPTLPTHDQAGQPGSGGSGERGVLREGEGQGDAVQGVGAEVVFAVGGEGGNDRGDQVAQALDVGGEDLEDFGLGNALALVEAGVQVGDQGQRRVAEGQLTGQDRLGVAGHADQGPALSGEPLGLGAGGEARALDDDQGARASRDPALLPGRGDGDDADRRAVRV